MILTLSDQVKCKECKHSASGWDPRHGEYVYICGHPRVYNEDGCRYVGNFPVCGWDEKWPFFEERLGEANKPTCQEVAERIGWMFYDPLMSKILTVFESQIEKSSRSDAIKNIIKDILSNTEKEIIGYLGKTFTEWGIKQ